MLFALLMLFADQAADGQGNPAGGNPGAGGLGMMLPFVAIAVLFYFFMIRPMRRQEQERQALLSAVQRNDRVVTSGGIIGVVADVKEKDDEIVLKVDENSNVRLRVTKGSIVRNLTGEKRAKEQKEGRKGAEETGIQKA
jgi:preprotein translocase subunit YajC